MRSHFNAYNALFPGYWKLSVSQISYHFILLSTIYVTEQMRRYKSLTDVTVTFFRLYLFVQSQQ